MAIPKKYLRSSEGAIATYNYTDIAEGTGVVLYYGSASSTNGSTIIYYLTTSNHYGTPAYTAYSPPTYPGAQLSDLDFDVTFNLPQNIKGNAYINSGVCNVGGNPAVVWLVARIRKWDGTTETEIANGTGTKLQIASGAGGVIGVTIPITTLQHFKAGDVLRCTIQLWGYYVDHDTTVRLGHDPSNTSIGTGTISSQIRFYVPFVLDL